MKKEMKYNIYKETFDEVTELLKMDNEEFKKLNWKKCDILYCTLSFYDDEIFTAIQLVVGDDGRRYIEALLGKDESNGTEEDVLVLAKIHGNNEGIEILTTVQTDTLNGVINLIYGDDDYEITVIPYNK